VVGDGFRGRNPVSANLLDLRLKKMPPTPEIEDEDEFEDDYD
jgi:hypothetical protein